MTKGVEAESGAVSNWKDGGKGKNLRSTRLVASAPRMTTYCPTFLAVNTGVASRLIRPLSTSQTTGWAQNPPCVTATNPEDNTTNRKPIQEAMSWCAVPICLLIQCRNAARRGKASQVRSMSSQPTQLLFLKQKKPLPNLRRTR